MLQRTLVSLVLLPFGLLSIYLGGWVFTGIILLFVGLAAHEYVLILRSTGHQPGHGLVVGGAILLVLGRAWNGFDSAPALISLVILVSAVYHMWKYEHGRPQAGSDMATSLGGILYVGWLGSYLISIRQFPDGMWWLLGVLGSVWLADSGAYLIGSRIGRHKLSPRLSPKKSWEGYFGGIFLAVPLMAFLYLLLRPLMGAHTAITLPDVIVLAVVLSMFPTLGDLAESMFKRQAGMKDSGNLLPGHGGFFDRIDSWLWAAVIGYYVIVWFFLGR